MEGKLESNRKTSSFYSLIFTFLILMIFSQKSFGVLIIEGDPVFQNHVKREIDLMKEGRKGLVSKVLIERLELATSTTTIQPITANEETWHPNDRKGTRSYVLPVDTKVRGAARTAPTNAILFLHPHRVDPSLSLYKLGTFAYELAIAMDLNRGEYSGDYQVREKRAVFFRNAWCDASKFSLIDTSGRIPTKDYQRAKMNGSLTEENAPLFPILISE